MRGTPSAYAALLASEIKPSDDTLYFISNPEDDSAVLYLGSKMIAGGDDLTSSSINELQDVLINSEDLTDKSLLVYDLKQQLWVNKEFKDFTFIGATETSNGISGFVPAPEKEQTNAFLCSNGSWVELDNAQVTGDNLSITINDKVVSLNNYGIQYYKYDSEADGHYILQVVDENNPWIAGLEPRVVLENNELVIGWYEPNSTTIEGVNSQITNLQSIITNLEDIVGEPANADNNNTASGIFAELDNKVNKTDVYTKTEVDTFINELESDISTELSSKADVSEVTESFELITEELSKKADKASVYTKEETQSYVESAIANVDHLKRKEVTSIEMIDIEAADATQYIYMIPSGLSDDDNKYYEYMVIEIDVVDEEGISTTIRKVEQVGSWEVNLTDYVKKSDLTTVKNELIEDLNEKVDKVYYIVENEDGTTSQVEGTLLTPEEKAKLAGLSVNPDGSVGISGTVNAENVQGLGTWITQNGNTYIQNLGENNLSENIKEKLNYITAVDGTSFTVTNGTLHLNEISADKVTGLSTLVTKVGNLEASLKALDETVNNETSGLSAVNTRVLALENTVNSLDDNYVSIVNFNKTVGDLSTLLTSTSGTIISQIEDINARLTWQELETVSE